MRLDLGDRPAKWPVRKGGHGDIGVHSRVNLADVGFIDAGANLYSRQVCHRQQRRTTAGAIGRRRDHGAALHRLLDDHAGDGRAHFGVTHRDLGVFERNAIANDGGIGLRNGKGGLLEFLLRDCAGGKEFLLALQLRQGVGKLGAIHLQCRARRGHLILGNPLVDLQHERTATHHIARLDLDVEDFTRRLGLHLHHCVGVDCTRRLCRDNDVALLHRNRLIHQNGRRLGTGGKE